MKIKIAAFFLAIGLMGCSTFNDVIEGSKTQKEYKTSAISVKTIGQGKDIILIPGLGSPPEVYNDLIEHLKPNYKIHLVHVAGYAGLEMEKAEGGIFNPAATQIAQYIKTSKIEGATLIGHSMGGELSMAVNARNPGLVSRILVVDAFTYYGLLFGPDTNPTNIAPRAKALSAMIKSQTPEQYIAAQKIAIAKLVKSEEKRALVLDWSVKSNRHAVAQGVEDLMTIDLRPELKENKAEIKLIYGHDNLMGLPLAYVDGLYANAYKDIPNAKIERIDNSLHFIMYDQPEIFIKKVDEFLK